MNPIPPDSYWTFWICVVLVYVVGMVCGWIIHRSAIEYREMRK